MAAALPQPGGHAGQNAVQQDSLLPVCCSWCFQLAGVEHLLQTQLLVESQSASTDCWHASAGVCTSKAMNRAVWEPR